MTSVETVSVLFTDLVGSTELSSRVGRERSEELRQEHFSLLREVIAASGGREVKNLGDGLMVTFPSAAAAAHCAVRIQQRLEQRNRRAEHPLEVRIGVSLGDATREDGDYFGPPVVEASRLSAKADGGQILTTEVVRLMVGSGDDYGFSPVGELELKGLPEPLPAFEVTWEPLPTGFAVELPPRLRSLPETGYVGRVAERAEIERLWRAAVAGERRVALVSGEPGIGKTRLATYLAQEAHAQGATVLYGRCEDELRLPYRPWIEALDHYLQAAPSSILEGHVERHGGQLRRLVPALARRVPELPQPQESDPETERYMLFAAVLDLLEDASADHPAVLVLDDLHWADRESLALFKHLVMASRPLRLLLIGTFRDSDITATHPLRPLLADLRREEGVERLALSGLEEEEVVALMEGAAGHGMGSPGLALAGEIRRETGGNPFFVEEILRHLVESGAIVQEADGRWRLTNELAEIGLPQSVREVVGRRVERLGPEAVSTLSAAAVIGRDFDLELLGRVVDCPEERLLDILDAAVAASVLRESADTPGRFAFTHALIEHSLYEELSRLRRARLHEQVAEALEELCGSDPGPRLPELAHHWSEAMRPASADRAIDYAARAGEQSLEQLAPDDAMRWFRQALDLADQTDARDAGTRCELLIGLGEAQRQSGDPAYRETLLEAAQLALELHDLDRLARACVANSRVIQSSSGEVDAERVAVLERAVELLPEEHPRRAQVMSILAVELTFGGDYRRRRALAEEALSLARRSGDDGALAYVLLNYCYVTWVPETLAERLRLSGELAALAERLGDPGARFWAAQRRALVALEAGEVQEARRQLGKVEAIAATVRQPLLQWVDLFERSLAAYLFGELDEAERLATHAAAVGTATGQPDAQAFFGAQLASIRRDQGRTGEIVDLIAQAVANNPGLPAFRAVLATAYCDLDREDEARVLLDAASARRFEDLPWDIVWSTAIAQWAETSAHLAATAPAAVLYRRLLPYAGQVITNGVTVVGCTDHYLGLLASTLSRREEAEDHFATAAETHERIGAPIWLARTRLAWGAELARSGALDDARRARELLEGALSDARRHGCALIERRARSAMGSAALAAD